MKTFMLMFLIKHNPNICFDILVKSKIYTNQYSRKVMC